MGGVDWGSRVGGIFGGDFVSIRWVEITGAASAGANDACQRGRSILFATAVDALNTLTAAQLAGRLKFELRKHLTPEVVLLDELGIFRSTRPEPI